VSTIDGYWHNRARGHLDAQEPGEEESHRHPRVSRAGRRRARRLALSQPGIRYNGPPDVECGYSGSGSHGSFSCSDHGKTNAELATLFTDHPTNTDITSYSAVWTARGLLGLLALAVLALILGSTVRRRWIDPARERRALLRRRDARRRVAD